MPKFGETLKEHKEATAKNTVKSGKLPQAQMFASVEERTIGGAKVRCLIYAIPVREAEASLRKTNITNADGTPKLNRWGKETKAHLGFMTQAATVEVDGAKSRHSFGFCNIYPE